MSDKQKYYICIDLKSFYASVECAERGLDVMTTRLVVADPERTDKTICLAVSPAMKALGVRNRCRVFEIPDGIDYIMAPPRMQLYIDYAAKIYSIYMHYISKEDIHVYSIDEAFMDVTDYLELYHMTPRELGMRIMEEIYEKLSIRATCGIGTNLYLTKVALDITAKHSPDFIGELNEETYRETLWDHQPLSDFWMVAGGTIRRLASAGISTMRGIASAPEDTIYHLFGVDAELLIDHAWGREPVTIADIHNYKAHNNSLSSGQVLAREYSFEDARLIVKEMMDLLCLDMVEKQLVTSSVTLHLSYAARLGLESSHGTVTLSEETNADILILPKVDELYTRIANPDGGVKRVSLTCNRILPEEYQQYSFFADPESLTKARAIQEAMIDIKNKFGKNAVLKGMNLQEAGTTRERNLQIGGHKSGK